MPKKHKRRTFLDLGIKTTAALPLLSTGLYSCSTKSTTSTSALREEKKSLNILILGGTSFLGPHQVAYALERGHKVTTFTRGKTQPSVHADLFDQVEMLIGDREDNLTALQNRKWDVVIDNSGRKLEWTQQTAELLKESCGLYMYTSSISVFYPYMTHGIKEDRELVLEMPTELEDENEQYVYDYGIMKAKSELATIENFGKDRSIIVRPSFIIGPGDNSNRFIHWPVRLNQGGEVILPGKPTDAVQYVDVRDLAGWMIRLAEEKKTGTFNAAGPKEQETVYDFAEEASAAFDVKTTFIKIDDHKFLEENDLVYIVPWVIPIKKFKGCSSVDNTKAVSSGLEFRSMTETIRDTHKWWISGDVPSKVMDKFNSTAEAQLAKEKDLIAKWRSQG